MNKNSVMAEERGKRSHPAANGEMLSAGNHQTSVFVFCGFGGECLAGFLLGGDFGNIRGFLPACSENTEDRRAAQIQEASREYRMCHEADRFIQMSDVIHSVHMTVSCSKGTS